MNRLNRRVDADSIAEFVLRERKRNGLTQAELAEIAEVSERFVRSVEGGKRTVRLDAVNALLAAFGARVGVVRRAGIAAEETE